MSVYIVVDHTDGRSGEIDAEFICNFLSVFKSRDEAQAHVEEMYKAGCEEGLEILERVI